MSMGFLFTFDLNKDSGAVAKKNQTWIFKSKLKHRRNDFLLTFAGKETEKVFLIFQPSLLSFSLSLQNSSAEQMRSHIAVDKNKIPSDDASLNEPFASEYLRPFNLIDFVDKEAFN